MKGAAKCITPVCAVSNRKWFCLLRNNGEERKFPKLLNMPRSWMLTRLWGCFSTEQADVLVLWGSPLLQRVVLAPLRAMVCSGSVNMFCSISLSTESRNCSWVSSQKGQLCQYKEELVQGLLSSLYIIRATKIRKEPFKPHWTVTLKIPPPALSIPSPKQLKNKSQPQSLSPRKPYGIHHCHV